MIDQTRDIIHSVRAVNRYYTRKIELLNNRLYGMDFSLTEAQMIFHAGENQGVTAVGFTKEKKYEKIILMTIDFLTPARRLYEKFGFALVSSEKTVELGREMSIEYLELKL